MRVQGLFREAIAEMDVKPPSDVPTSNSMLRFCDGTALQTLLAGAGLVEVIAQDHETVHVDQMGTRCGVAAWAALPSLHPRSPIRANRRNRRSAPRCYAGLRRTAHGRISPAGRVQDRRRTQARHECSLAVLSNGWKFVVVTRNHGDVCR